MAADLCAGSPIQVHAVTASYPGAPRTDERAFAADVAGTAGATHHIVEWGPTEALYRGMPENAFYWDEPIFNVHSHAMALAKHRVLQSIGGDVVLGGAGAEPLLGEYMEWPVFLADDLIRGRWRDLRDGVRRWQCARRAPLLVLLYRACLEPLLRPVAAMSHEARMATPPWLTQRSRRRFATLQAAQLGPTVNRLNTAGAWMAEQWQGAGVSAEQGYGAYAYDTRYPFLYRPLVESVLRMPWSVRVMPRTNKALLRRLAQTLLPAGFASRRSSCADQAASRAMAAQRDRFDGFVRSPALADLGLVDAPRLRASIELAQSGFGRGLRFTVTVLAVELWLRSVLSGDWRRQQLQHLWPREAHVPVSL
jgi:asparagine synthetase B (glutamine-hydrolysing)